MTRCIYTSPGKSHSLILVITSQPHQQHMDDHVQSHTPCCESNLLLHHHRDWCQSLISSVLQDHRHPSTHIIALLQRVAPSLSSLAVHPSIQFQLILSRLHSTIYIPALHLVQQHALVVPNPSTTAVNVSSNKLVLLFPRLVFCLSLSTRYILVAAFGDRASRQLSKSIHPRTQSTVIQTGQS